MTHTITRLLTAEERRALYAYPILNDSERNEYFTLSDHEIQAMERFQNVEAAVYFVIALVCFKLKHTLIRFRYRDATRERQHVMQRYFPHQAAPRRFPTDKDVIMRIENKVLAVVGCSRFRGSTANMMITTLQNQASHYPRQRQLCQALLHLMRQERVAIPGMATLQQTITRIWNNELARVIKAYYRYTVKTDREQVLALLDKTDEQHRIVSIKKDMQQFNTADIHKELAKHRQLKAIFTIAEAVLPKLQLPAATADYYAQLINYYNGVRLQQLDTDTVQLYLLCYGYSRFQIVNDNLLEAFKKRTANYADQAASEANLEAAKFVDEIQSVRQNVHDLLMAINRDTHKTAMPKSTLFDCIPESELATTAQLLLSDQLDKRWLFWRYIDKHQQAIKLNLRPLFMQLDITIVRHDKLKAVVDFMKSYLDQADKTAIDVPTHVTAWIPPNDLPYIVANQDVDVHRLEFLLYQQLAYHIATNKLVLACSVKHKAIEDHFIAPATWKKNKRQWLQSLPYPKLHMSPKTLLADKARCLTALYTQVNAAMRDGEHPDIIVKTGQQGDTVWRLRPLEQAADPNESLFAHCPKRSIVDVLHFVNDKTHFSQAFESILPRSTKQPHDWTFTSAVVLANALRMGTRSMAEVCDLPLPALLTAESAYVRMETLTQATHSINLAAEKLAIFRYYDIDGKRHASLDGLKLGSRIKNIAARHSPKFFGLDVGVSAYNIIFNYFSLAGRLISANDYEGNFTFEMAHHQNTQEFKCERASTDKVSFR